MSAPSVVVAVVEAIEDSVDATCRLGAVDDGVVRLAGAGDRGHDEIEVELADQLEAIDVAVAVAAVEHCRYPLAAGKEDGVAGEQASMFAGIPQQGGGSAGVARGGNDLEVVVDEMALGECLVDVARFRDLGRVFGVAEERRAEGLGDPVACR